MYQIKKEERNGEAIKRIIREEIDEALRLLKDPDIEKEAAIHETRKSTKRIRAALRLVREEIGDSIFNRENASYRDAAREIAPLRDSVVMVETVDILRNEDDPSLTAESFQVVYQKLVKIREATHKDFLERRGAINNIVVMLSEARERVETLPIKRQGFEAFENGLREVYRRGRQRMKAAYANGHSSAKFHNWRKQVKYLWHLIEFLQPLSPPLLEVVAIELHQLSDYLGEAHDTAVLAKYIRENDEEFREEPELNHLLTKLDQRQQSLEAAAYPLGQRLYAEKPNQFVQRFSLYWEAFQQ